MEVEVEIQSKNLFSHYFLFLGRATFTQQILLFIFTYII